MNISTNTVMIILGMLLAAGNAGDIRDYVDEIITGAQQVATAGDLRSISLMLDLHYMKRGRYPESERFGQWMKENFKENQIKDLCRDHWGHALVYSAGPDLHSFKLISIGPDGVEDTPDDLHYTGP